VKLPPDSPLSDVIASVAARLHVDLDVEAGSKRAEIGTLPVPDDAPGWHVEAAVLRALAPRHVLFLCVANSARSQLAEGLARSMAPEGVKISSAGSVPTQVRPQAIEALAEQGIDIAHHRSTGLDEVVGPVDAVITLCAEEVCPVWLGTAWRLHWGLPDPAGAGETPEGEMQAFRGVRDELRRRFEVLFG
jgi:arsenate reductase